MTDKTRTRSRMVLLLLAALFAAPLVVAIALHASGWEPSITRNRGELIEPVVDLRDLTLHRADASEYAWEPQARRWRVVVLPDVDCSAACSTLIADLEKVWQLQGRRADRLDVLWFGMLPDDATSFRRLIEMQPDAELRARLPENLVDEAGSPAAYLVDPSGFLAMRYAPGFDPGGMREDVARLLK
jgi:cytochrome oxidase Cu insertion factor (SCO1/SenC/PrrC family)